MAQVMGGFDPCADGIVYVCQGFLWGFAVAHAAGEVWYGCDEAAAVFGGERFDDESVALDVHGRFLTASTNWMSWRIYTGFIGRLKGMVSIFKSIAFGVCG